MVKSQQRDLPMSIWGEVFRTAISNTAEMVRLALVQRRWHRHFKTLLRLKASYGCLRVSDDLTPKYWYDLWWRHEHHIEELRCACLTTDNCSHLISVLLPKMTHLQTIRVTHYPKLNNWCAERWVTLTAATLTHLELIGTSVGFNILYTVKQCRHLRTLVLDVSPGTPLNIWTQWNMLNITSAWLREHLLTAIDALASCQRLSRVTLRRSGDLFTDATLERLVAAVGDQLHFLRLESCGKAVTHGAVLRAWDACPRMRHLSLINTGRVDPPTFMIDVQACARRCSDMRVKLRSRRPPCWLSWCPFRFNVYIALLQLRREER